MPPPRSNKGISSSKSHHPISRYFVPRKKRKQHDDEDGNEEKSAAPSSSNQQQQQQQQQQHKRKPPEAIDLISLEDHDCFDSNVDIKSGDNNNNSNQGISINTIFLNQCTKKAQEVEENGRKQILADHKEEHQGPPPQHSNRSPLTSTPDNNEEEKDVTLLEDETHNLDDHNDEMTTSISLIGSSAVSTTTTNPFERFAFYQTSSSSAAPASSCYANDNPPKTILLQSTKNYNKDRRHCSMDKELQQQQASKTKSGGGTTKDYVRVADMSLIERENVIEKWHSIIESSSSGEGRRVPAATINDNIEDARFELFVAAQLHARCREGSVRKALVQLRKAFQEDEGNQKQLSVKTMSSSRADATFDDDAVEKSITNLQYHSTKARYLVKAANEIRTLYGGIVPEREHELLQLTGIGPVLADLLAFVNTKKMHTERRCRVGSGLD